MYEVITLHRTDGRPVTFLVDHIVAYLDETSPGRSRQTAVYAGTAVFFVVETPDVITEYLARCARSQP